MNTQLMTIPFHGDKVNMVDLNGEPYVSLKPIVENLGLDWDTQLHKVKGDKKWNYRDIPTVAKDGKNRVMACIPLNRTRAWLFSINPNKVRYDLRSKIETYQEECCDVLDSYWSKGHAINPRMKMSGIEVLDDALWAYWSKGHAVNHRHPHGDSSPKAKIEVEESEYWKLRAELAELKLSKYIPSRTQRRLTDEEKARIDGLYFSEGYGYTRIADALGRNRSTIRDHIKRKTN